MPMAAPATARPTVPERVTTCTPVRFPVITSASTCHHPTPRRPQNSAWGSKHAGCAPRGEILASSTASRHMLRAVRAVDAAATAAASQVSSGASAARDRGVLHAACRRPARAVTTFLDSGGGTPRWRQQRVTTPSRRRYGCRLWAHGGRGEGPCSGTACHQSGTINPPQNTAKGAPAGRLRQLAAVRGLRPRRGGGDGDTIRSLASFPQSLPKLTGSSPLWTVRTTKAPQRTIHPLWPLPPQS